MTYERDFTKEIRVGDPDNLMRGSIFSIVEGETGYLVLAVHDLKIFKSNVGEAGLYNERLNSTIAFEALTRPEALVAYGLLAIPIEDVPAKEVKFWLKATNLI